MGLTGQGTGGWGLGHGTWWGPRQAVGQEAGRRG